MNVIPSTTSNNEQEFIAGAHWVAIYRDIEQLLPLVENFVSAGLLQGQGVIVVASAPLRLALQERLLQRCFNMAGARARQQYIVLDARDTLQQIIAQGWPQMPRFEQFTQALISRARGPGRPVRCFGEGVNMLWGLGHGAATLRLEQLWDKVCKKEQVMSLCAYQHIHFTPNIDAEAYHKIHRLHSHTFFV